MRMLFGTIYGLLRNEIKAIKSDNFGNEEFKDLDELPNLEEEDEDLDVYRSQMKEIIPLPTTSNLHLIESDLSVSLLFLSRMQSPLKNEFFTPTFSTQM